MATFDTSLLDTLRTIQEIRIQAGAANQPAVTIWIVVIDGAVYVRSYRGPRGQWYVAALATRQAVLEVGGQRIPVGVVPVDEPAIVEAVSQAFFAKYAASAYVQAMLGAEARATTLRLDALA